MASGYPTSSRGRQNGFSWHDFFPAGPAAELGRSPATKEVTAMRVRPSLLVILAVAGVATVTYQLHQRTPAGRKSAAPAGRPSVETQQGTPVATNRGPEILDGFRGDLHPLLFGRARLEVTAQWTTVGKGRDQLHRDLHPALYRWFTDLQPARLRHTYTGRDFSAFLPEEVGEVGQVWALDGDKMVGVLKQFHPRPSLQLVASGRRAGPDGAFALLRAVSPSHVDIVFRIHAEFSLTPEDWRPDRSLIPGRPLIRAWYTPAYFTGRVLVNLKTGTVDHFRLALASDQALNVHLTLEAKWPRETRQPHEIVRVEQMELTGGDGGPAAKVSWTKALTPAEADRRLAKVFYKFLDIDWVPFDQVAAQARSQNRPIFAIVSWGAFDDQSC
jgi:hypothetical protein